MEKKKKDSPFDIYYHSDINCDHRPNTFLE